MLQIESEEGGWSRSGCDAKVRERLFRAAAAHCTRPQYAAEAGGKKEAGEIGADVMSLTARGVHKTINWAQAKKTE